MDPISASFAAAAGKALSSSGDDATSAGGGAKWLERVLGPSADEVGEALRRWTSYRVRNTQRISDAASRKAEQRVGNLPQRVVYQVLDDGSLVDDELGAEYFGGLLAASVTPSGRDDRAVAWTKLLTQMSSIEIRTHYLLYQQWWILLAEENGGPINIDLLSDETTLFVDTGELCRRLAQVVGDEGNEQDMTLVIHAVSALARHDLITSASLGWGSREDYAENKHRAFDLPFDHAVCTTPSLSGIELWGYAHGESSLTHGNFAAAAAASDLEMVIPPLRNVALAKTVAKPVPPTEALDFLRQAGRRAAAASGDSPASETGL